MIQFTIIDYILIAGYFLVALYIGLKSKNTESSKLDYLVAGRKLTLPAFVATLVATFYGGVLGVGEFVWTTGISSWFLYAFPYYVFIIIFALFFAAKIRKSNLFTIPDKLEATYGRKVSMLGAFFVFLLITPAPYLFMLGILVEMVFGTPLILSMIICLIVSIIFLFKGGLKADVNVNIFEFILMYVGFFVIIPFCFTNIGGLNYLTENLSDLHLDITGGNSFQYILVWFFIGAWAIVDPSFHQRCYAAKSEKVARNGVLISLIFWLIFDTMTMISGLYASAYLKNLENPTFAYPVLANAILPGGFKALFFIGLIATIMSTLHSYVFISASTLGNDVFSKFSFLNAKLKEDKNLYTQIGIAITGIISILIVLFIPSVVNMWYTIGSLVIPALLIGVVTSYFLKLKINNKFIFSAMFASFTVSLVSFLYGRFNVDGSSYANYLWNIEPMYPGLFAGLVIYLTGYFIQKSSKLKNA
jgi:SSS family solute:Na+ symporter